MKIKLMSSTDGDDSHPMHFKSDNIGIMIGNYTYEIIDEHFFSLLTRYQIVL